MSKFKKWLINKFLPAYCREELTAENARLTKENSKQAQEIDRLNAYIDGLEFGMRSRSRIVIKNEVSK